jgi:beta-lactam-binding protein with PASTA domain
VPAATEERVLLQAPCADAPTPLGTLVTLVVPAFRTVPDLVGRTVREARTLAATAGLDLGVEAGTPSDAPVARQDPSSGERAAVGSTVRVVPGEPSPVKDG